MFKSPQQRLAFFNALKQKNAGTMPHNPVQQPVHNLPLAAPVIGAQSMPSMSSALNKPMMPPQENANPAMAKPQAPMGFLKLRRTLKPKV